MTVDASSFTGIKLNSFEESACSPKLAGNSRGMVIATPDVIDLAGPLHEALGREGARPVLPVCGTIRFDAATEARFLSIVDQILLVAIDTKTHVSYVSSLADKDSEIPISPRPTPQQLDEWKNRVETAYFNANAFYYLEDLPAAPARYHIFAVVGDIVSNLRKVTVVGQGSEKATRKIAPGDVLFGKRAKAPSVAVDFRGVEIRPRTPSWPKDGGPMWVDGMVQLGTEDAAAVGATPIQKALVATVSSGMVYRTWNPAGEQALFVDDQERGGQVVRGAFSVDLAPAFGPSKGEGVYVMFSVGASLSNILFIPPS